MIKKTEEQIEAKLDWLNKAIDYPENQDNITQCRLYAYKNFIEWLKGEREGL